MAKTFNEIIGKSQEYFQLTTTGDSFYDMFLKDPKKMQNDYGVKSEIVEMTPDEYIRQIAQYVLDSDIEEQRQKMSEKRDAGKIDKLAGLMKDGVKLKLAWLDKALKTQDGRHRALALKKIGVNKMPVLVISENVAKAMTFNEVMKSDDNSLFNIAKKDEDKRLVFGWGNISKTITGELVEDLQGDSIEIEDLESSAYEYVLNFRDTGVEHDPSIRKVGRLVESCVFTKEKQQAIGIAPGQVPEGWWVGFYIDDDATWEGVKSGKFKMFSVEGKAQRVEKAMTFNEVMKFNPYHDSRNGQFTSGNAKHGIASLGRSENGKRLLAMYMRTHNYDELEADEKDLYDDSKEKVKFNPKETKPEGPAWKQPAKTPEEASQMLVDSGACKYANFSGCTNMDNVNAVKDKSIELFEKYGVQVNRISSEELGKNTGGQYSMYQNDISINTKLMNSSREELNKSWVTDNTNKAEKAQWDAYYTREKAKLENWIQSTGYSASKGYRQSLERLEKQNKEYQRNADRYNVVRKDHVAEDVFTHEYGHALSTRKFSFPIHYGYSDGANKLIASTKSKATKSGDIAKLSTYARTNGHEFFAEAFTAKYIGESIPSYIDSAIETIINWK